MLGAGVFAGCAVVVGGIEVVLATVVLGFAVMVGGGVDGAMVVLDTVVSGAEVVGGAMVVGACRTPATSSTVNTECCPNQGPHAHLPCKCHSTAGCEKLLWGLSPDVYSETASSFVHVKVTLSSTPVHAHGAVALLPFLW